MKRSLLVGSMLVIAAVVLLSSPRSHVVAAGDPAVLINVDKEFDAATAARGLEGFSSFLADDITTIRPDVPTLHGKQSFVDGWKKNYATSGVSVRWQPQFARISDDATLGFTVGTYVATLTKDGVSRTSGTGKYITIWRKQADGSWKDTFDSGVSDTPPAAATEKK